MVGVVIAQTLWSQSLNGSFNVTISANASLWNNAALTQPCTSITLTPSTIDGGDLTTVMQSQPIYVCYTGSQTGNLPFSVTVTGLDSSWTVTYTESVSNTVHANGYVISGWTWSNYNTNGHLGVFSVVISIQQNTAHTTASTQNLAANFQIGS